MIVYIALSAVCCTEKDTQYVVSVRAFNQVGKGPVVYDLVYTTDSPTGSILHSSSSIRLSSCIYLILTLYSEVNCSSTHEIGYTREEDGT